MDRKKFIRYLGSFGIVFIIILFVYDIASHGTIVHPGKAFYASQCSQCHGDDGEGIKSLVPPLRNADFAARNLDSIPCWLKFGLNHPITVNDTLYDQPMYPNKMDEVQIANVINFMNEEFFHSDKVIDKAWVRERWKGCK